MRARFIACGACARHVRQGDVACPFCGAPAPSAPPVERVLGRGLSRAAMFAAGTAGVVVALADCSSGNVSTATFYGVATCGDASCIPTGDDASADGAGASDGPDLIGDGSAPPPDASDASSGNDAGDGQPAEAAADADGGAEKG